MAKEKPDKNAEPKEPVAPAEGAAEQSSKGGTIKAIIAILAVLLLEGGTIMGVRWMSGKPAEVKAEGVAADVQAANNKLVEVTLLKDKFDNQKTGRTYFYDTEIVVTVRQKDVEKFKADLEASKAQIQVDMQTIFRLAEPSVFSEPTRATLTRQIKASLDQRFGKNAEDQFIVQDVLIPKCLPYRADY